MTPQPIHFVLDEASFDGSLLPPNARRPGSPAFRQAVSAYFHNAYAALGGTVDVDFAEGRIGVSWRSAQADEDPMGGIVELLKAGKYADARPMLEALLPVQPDNLDVLYNLGMVYSDEGRLEEARSLLRRATQIAPEHANAFVALGVAALRARDTDEAESALTRAVELEPRNPYALRTLGTLRLTKGDASGAVGLLRQAVTQAPGDPIALLTLAQALIRTDLASHGSEADGLLKRVFDHRAAWRDRREGQG